MAGFGEKRGLRGNSEAISNREYSRERRQGCGVEHTRYVYKCNVCELLQAFELVVAVAAATHQLLVSQQVTVALVALSLCCCCVSTPQL